MLMIFTCMLAIVYVGCILECVNFLVYCLCFMDRINPVNYNQLS